MQNLEFRVFDKYEKRFIYPNFQNRYHCVISLDGKFENLQNGVGGDEVVIQQWTGLFDKNKTKIFAGDLVNFCYTYKQNGEFARAENQEVFFEEGIFYFGRGMMFATNDVNFLEESLEVVGNIFGV